MRTVKVIFFLQSSDKRDSLVNIPRSWSATVLSIFETKILTKQFLGSTTLRFVDHLLLNFTSKPAEVVIYSPSPSPTERYTLY